MPSATSASPSPHAIRRNTDYLQTAMTSSPKLSLRLVEVFQIGRRLVFARGHQQSLGALEIAFVPDEDVLVVLGTMVLDPDRIGVALVASDHRPWPRQCMVERRDLVA